MWLKRQLKQVVIKPGKSDLHGIVLDRLREDQSLAENRVNTYATSSKLARLITSNISLK